MGRGSWALDVSAAEGILLSTSDDPQNEGKASERPYSLTEDILQPGNGNVSIDSVSWGFSKGNASQHPNSAI